MKINYKWLIVGLIVLAIIVIALLYFYPLEKKTTDTAIDKQDVATEEVDSGTETLPTGYIQQEGEGVADPEDDGVEWTENAVGLAVNQLPIIKDEHSLFYDYEIGSFLAKINATENSAEALKARENIKSWFDEQNVDMSEITIKYLYAQ